MIYKIVMLPLSSIRLRDILHAANCAWSESKNKYHQFQKTSSPNYQKMFLKCQPKNAYKPTNN